MALEWAEFTEKGTIAVFLTLSSYEETLPQPIRPVRLRFGALSAAWLVVTMAAPVSKVDFAKCRRFTGFWDALMQRGQVVKAAPRSDDQVMDYVSGDVGQAVVAATVAVG